MGRFRENIVDGKTDRSAPSLTHSDRVKNFTIIRQIIRSLHVYAILTGDFRLGGGNQALADWKPKEAI